MTENKRFTITQDFEEHHRQIRDNGHIIMGCFIEPQAKVIVDMLNDLNDENEQLKQRCKELRNDLIDHSALINMLEKVKALNIEDMIWNTMEYKTQTEFDDDFADYREYAKKRWKE